MRAPQLIEYLVHCILNRKNVLITGQPGAGKTDCGKQAAAIAKAKLLVWYPVLDDPTDYKGAYMVENGKATFIAFRENEEIFSEDLVVVLIDDLGQANPSVQAALMNVIHARTMYNRPIGKNVVFIATTNRRQDNSGVTVFLEPLKSKFNGGICELEVKANDWIIWAIETGQPKSLITFAQFRSDLLEDWKPEREIRNSSSPRTFAAAGDQQNTGISKDKYFETFKATTGEIFATEYCGFLDLIGTLPTYTEIVSSPQTARIPDNRSAKFALIGLIAENINRGTMDQAMIYLNRIELEIQAACLIQAKIRHPEIQTTAAYIDWITKNAENLVE